MQLLIRMRTQRFYGYNYLHTAWTSQFVASLRRQINCDVRAACEWGGWRGVRGAPGARGRCSRLPGGPPCI